MAVNLKDHVRPRQVEKGAANKELGSMWTQYTKPFYKYSARNAIGHRPNRQALLVREKVLALWSSTEQTTFEIALSLEISEETVRSIIRRQRRKGDPRAMSRRHSHYIHRQNRANERRRKILQMHTAGASKQEIAGTLGVSPKLVEIRIKEAGNGKT